MITALAPADTDLGFAERSARYLADRGCDTAQIQTALVQQLDIGPHVAERIAQGLAA